ncbi:Crp/Fnr family transcriptional regulator [Xylophilus sp.]|uniref:Crp/Fnr family transcriptional regulator n=1 Tax=Xylophilus sp. TaxID=2653893 RepID=UPI002D7F3256|nr:Crp/Fnr family transcriptional regulator [Xylophilus sp.]
MAERAFRKGERLLLQGRVAPTFGVIKVGTVLGLRSGDDGVERPAGLLGRGQALDGTALLLQPAALSCQALSAGRVCEVDVAAATQLGLVDAAFLRDLLLAHAQAHARLADWTRVLGTRSVAGRLAGALLQLAGVQRSVLVRLPSHTVLAALLATTRETIARTLRQFEADQCLARRDRWHCEIDRERLLAFATDAPPRRP